MVDHMGEGGILFPLLHGSGVFGLPVIHSLELGGNGLLDNSKGIGLLFV